jgi:antitoxin component YwqK of YwqJK toxin-antitoxin module
MLKDIIYVTSLVTLLLIITGCQEQVNGKDENIKYTYYKGGKIESTTEYVDGVRHGYQKFYYEEGELLSETIFVNGSKEGMMKIYYPDGTLKLSGNYVNNFLDGEVFSYYPNSKIESKKIFEKGKMVYNASYTIDGEIVFEDKF